MKYQEQWWYLILGGCVFAASFVYSATIGSWFLVDVAKARKRNLKFSVSKGRKGARRARGKRKSASITVPKESIHEKVIRHGSMASVGCYTLYCLLLLLRRVADFRLMTWMPVACDVSLVATVAVFLSGKYSMYTVLIGRIKVAFENTAYEYKTLYIRGIYALLCTLYLTQVSLLWIFSGSHKHESNRLPNGHRYDEDDNGHKQPVQMCDLEIPVPLILLAIGLDILISATLVTMFANPLRRLHEARNEFAPRRPRLRLQINAPPSQKGSCDKDAVAQHSFGHSSKSSGSLSESSSAIGGAIVTRPRAYSAQSLCQIEMHVLPLKYSVAIAIAVCSTASNLLVIYSTGMGLTTALDAAVNLTCIILMSSRWSRCYWRLCGPLMSCMAATGCLDHALKQSVDRVQEHFSAIAAHSQAAVVCSQRCRAPTEEVEVLPRKRMKLFVPGKSVSQECLSKQQIAIALSTPTMDSSSTMKTPVITPITPASAATLKTPVD